MHGKNMGAALAAALLSAGAMLTSGATARAEAAPESWRSTEYYVLHGAISATLVGASALTAWVGKEVEAGGDTIWFPGDSGLRGTCSPEAAQLSDTTLALAVAFPLAAELGGGLDARFVNAEIVYTQALLANHLLTSVAKVVFRRPRPFSYRKDVECAFSSEPSDVNKSFFSGHASGSFSAAFAGVYLLSESGRDARTRAALWGAELALAGATANLRARAGKHYYSDILVGALVGAAVGTAVPVLHGGDQVPAASDFAAGATGLVIGLAGSQLIAIGAEAIDADVLSRVVLSPLPALGALGLQATGNW